jgi:hypothetical protein
LRTAEAERARLARNALDAAATAETADQVTRDLRAQHRAVAVEWAARTRSMSLPPDVAMLDRLCQESTRIVDVLDGKASELNTKPVGHVRALLVDAWIDDDKAAGATLSAKAKVAHERATEAEAKLEHLQRIVGSSAAQAVHEYNDAVAAEMASHTSWRTSFAARPKR